MLRINRVEPPKNCIHTNTHTHARTELVQQLIPHIPFCWMYWFAIAAGVCGYDFFLSSYISRSLYASSNTEYLLFVCSLSHICIISLFCASGRAFSALHVLAHSQENIWLAPNWLLDTVFSLTGHVSRALVSSTALVPVRCSALVCRALHTYNIYKSIILLEHDSVHGTGYRDFAW